MMNIQDFFLLSLSLTLLASMWRVLLPGEQFLQLHCNVGQISRPSGTEQVMDCSSCLTFPLESRQTGRIRIRNGSPEQQKDHHRSQEYEVYANLYMQTECIEYDCPILITPTSFSSEQVVKSAGLVLVRDTFAYVDAKIWELELEYDNHLGQSGMDSDFKANLFMYLMGYVLPSPLLPTQQFYKGMAIKLRATRPVQNIEGVSKPVIKITQIAETRADFISISIIIAFTLAFKSNFFHFDHNLKVLNVLMCFGFVSPYLFSLFALVIFALRDPLHTISLFSFVLALCLDYDLAVIISVLLSSFFLLKESHKVVSLCQILSFNLIILLAAFNGIESIVSSSLCLLLALCEQTFESRYNKVSSKQKNQGEVELKESEGMLGIEQ